PLAGLFGFDKWPMMQYGHVPGSFTDERCVTCRERHTERGRPVLSPIPAATISPLQPDLSRVALAAVYGVGPIVSASGIGWGTAPRGPSAERDNRRRSSRLPDTSAQKRSIMQNLAMQRENVRIVLDGRGPSVEVHPYHKAV